MKLRALGLAAVVVAGATDRARAQDTDMFEAGQALFEAVAPPEFKAEFAFPTREQWDEFAARLEKTRQTGSLAELAGYEPEARVALAALRVIPGYEDYADWLAERLDDIVVAKAAATAEAVAPASRVEVDVTRTPTEPVEVTPPPSREPQPTPAPKPTPTPAPVRTAAGAGVPMYGLWVERLQGRPRPAGADALLPVLRGAFDAQGVAEALVWLAESESTFNPRARSPAGARGLFQLMPVTAKAMGLSLLPLDERTHPEKSARAAAALLRKLHGMFGSWPLALAAYNSGEGTVRRMLKANGATTYAEIAAKLPSETRLYVPKVLATVALRTGVMPEDLVAPKSL
jgi:membrane-bound lytic murein transglycosylase D